MRKLTLVLLALHASSAFAWEKIIDCNDGALVVDKECSSYRGVPCYLTRHQIVLNDANIVRYFNSQGALGYYQYGYGFQHHDSRFILNDSTVKVSDDRNLVTASVNIPLYIPYQDTSYPVEYRLTRRGEGMLLQAIKSNGNRDDIVRQGELANWYFERCSSR